MSDILFIDIETAARPQLPEPPASVLEKGMGVLKDPAKIAAKVDKNREDWMGRAPLDWRRGQVIAFGTMYPEDEEPAVHTQRSAGSEAVLLEKFWSGKWADDTVVGFNIRQFDIPFLIGRSAACGVKPSRKFNLAKFRRDLGIIDLMEMLSFDGAFDLTGFSLGYYCEFFDLPTSPYGEGKDIAEWYAEDKWDEIVKHLEADVLMTRDLYDFACGAFI